MRARWPDHTPKDGPARDGSHGVRVVGRADACHDVEDVGEDARLQAHAALLRALLLVARRGRRKRDDGEDECVRSVRPTSPSLPASNSRVRVRTVVARTAPLSPLLLLRLLLQGAQIE